MQAAFRTDFQPSAFLIASQRDPMVKAGYPVQIDPGVDGLCNGCPGSMPMARELRARDSQCTRWIGGGAQGVHVPGQVQEAER